MVFKLMKFTLNGLMLKLMMQKNLIVSWQSLTTKMQENFVPTPLYKIRYPGLTNNKFCRILILNHHFV